MSRYITEWLARFWDFIDSRDIDKHVFAWATAICGWELTQWGMDFALIHSEMDGIKMAAIVVAVGGPYTLFATAVTKWYFARLSKEAE